MLSVTDYIVMSKDGAFFVFVSTTSKFSQRKGKKKHVRDGCLFFFIKVKQE